jgi:hypothetical protein
MGGGRGSHYEGEGALADQLYRGPNFLCMALLQNTVGLVVATPSSTTDPKLIMDYDHELSTFKFNLYQKINPF